MLLPLLFLLMILFVPVIMLLLQPLMLFLETNSVVVSTFVVYFLVIKKLYNVKRLCIVVKTEWQNINKVKYLTLILCWKLLKKKKKKKSWVKPLEINKIPLEKLHILNYFQKLVIDARRGLCSKVEGAQSNVFYFGG